MYESRSHVPRSKENGVPSRLWENVQIQRWLTLPKEHIKAISLSQLVSYGMVLESEVRAQGTRPPRVCPTAWRPQHWGGVSWSHSIVGSSYSRVGIEPNVASSFSHDFWGA